MSQWGQWKTWFSTKPKTDNKFWHNHKLGIADSGCWSRLLPSTTQKNLVSYTWINDKTSKLLVLSLIHVSNLAHSGFEGFVVNTLIPPQLISNLHTPVSVDWTLAVWCFSLLVIFYSDNPFCNSTPSFIIRQDLACPWGLCLLLGKAAECCRCSGIIGRKPIMFVRCCHLLSMQLLLLLVLLLM